MKQELIHIALVVKEYDEAIEFYTKKLNFDLAEDSKLSPTKRWVLVRPKGSLCSLLLAKAATEEQLSRVGNQTGEEFFFFFIQIIFTEITKTSLATTLK